jgi:hypothetical protein
MRHFRSFSAHLLGTLILSLAVLSPTGAAAAPAADFEHCFPETGNCITGRIREFWETNGGLEVFGYPTGPLTTMTVEGRSIQGQWFERERLELHPENTRPYDVLLGRLGVDRLAQLGRTPPPMGARDPQCQLFVDTNHSLCEPFRSYFISHGLNFDGGGVNAAESLGLFGFPLGEATMESNGGGPLVLTQWFERARMEYHPGNAQPYQVLLGLLGNDLKGVTASGAAPPVALPGGWLARLNAHRVAAGVPPVSEDPALSAAAAQHIAYMLANPDEYVHNETPGAPGFTAAGQQAAQQSNLFRAGPGFTAEAAVDGWIDSIAHRFGMLRPELTRTGFALDCDARGCAAAMNVLAAADGPAQPDGVVYPGDGQTGVSTGLISWQSGSFDPALAVSTASVHTAAGQDVPITVLPANGFFNIVTLKPGAPLAPATAYTVDLTITQAGASRHKVWTFRTK